MQKKYPLFSSLARELSENEILQIINNFVKAVERAKQAGFSGVQLQAARGYLLQEFLSPHLNTRNDRWGGNTGNRFKIISEIIYKSREKVGNLPVLAKFSEYDKDRDGIRIDEGIKIAELLTKEEIAHLLQGGALSVKIKRKRHRCLGRDTLQGIFKTEG